MIGAHPVPIVLSALLALLLLAAAAVGDAVEYVYGRFPPRPAFAKLRT
jgi:membrane protein DedA with SNARE-associated domain